MKSGTPLKTFKPAQHTYTDLAKTCLGSTELYNIYGIVIDATTPHLKPNEANSYKRFKQHVKIIDPSFHFRQPRDPNDLTNGSISVTLFAQNLAQLPTFKHVGDIIRIHRCNVGVFKERKTFSCIMNFGSSWVVFNGAGSMVSPTADVDMSDED